MMLRPKSSGTKFLLLAWTPASEFQRTSKRKLTMPRNIRIFEVGGSIRDELMGIDNPPDRDFCAEAPSFTALLEWCKINMD